MLGRADPLRVERRPNPTQVDAYLNNYILQQIPKRPGEHYELRQNYKEGIAPTNYIMSTAITLKPKFTLSAGPEYPGCQFLVTVRDSMLVVVLGKHWPWSTVSYAYHKIATKEPMVMSMMLASAAREIYRSRLYDKEKSLGHLPSSEQPDMDGRAHYGRALSSLREALKQEVKSPQQIEAIFITLWLMIDYENRFGSGASAINIHIRGIETLLYNHIVPLLECHTRPAAIMDCRVPSQQPKPHMNVSTLDEHASNSDSATLAPPAGSTGGLGGTCVPLFLLWTLYFFTPAALFFGSGTGRLDTDIFRFFLQSETGNSALSLSELYRLSRQSPSRFWGDGYPMSSQLDDLENLPGLTLYHRSHVIQFKITEMFKHTSGHTSFGEDSPYQRIANEINTLSIEYDTLLTSAKLSPSCDVAGNRRVMETIFWSAITYYGTVVYFHLCFEDLAARQPEFQTSMIPLTTAVSLVLELSLKLHRSRPRLLVRITWPLFIAGIATSDQIYQDWVSIRLRELGKYGQNYDRISRRFDEISRGGPLLLS
ncbi:hypothetical protein N7519_007899 [Penicillium mononematosum]|uniref:uncharacterized protein n=1 Tax=Penicillium mononematosum TaxID=268346 RepID=UPI00254862F1|nr:uncharacterized protein N7519_007899 [Penicillium mononematosum]KAJ6186598.1 hypothetical protein N7519_007899 [Penicillium mononematosum]